jgi:hypothetical protein
MKMKIMLFVCLVLFTECNAQETKPFYSSSYNLRNNDTFSKKSFLTSIGIGFPSLSDNFFTFDYPANGSYSPKLYVEFEHGFLRDEIGIGACMESGWGSRAGSTNEKINQLSIGLSGYYHFNKWIAIKNLDVYAGLGVIYTREILRADGKQDFIHSNVFDNSRIGARYYVLPKIALYFQYSPQTGRSGFIGRGQRQFLSGGITFRMSK